MTESVIRSNYKAKAKKGGLNNGEAVDFITGGGCGCSGRNNFFFIYKRKKRGLNNRGLIMGLSQNPEYEKALILDNHLEEIEISTYLNGLDLADKLLIRDTYYLFCGNESKQEKAISKIIKTIKKKGGLKRCQ